MFALIKIQLFLFPSNHVKLELDSFKLHLDFLHCQPLKDWNYTAQLSDQMVGVIVKWIGENVITRHYSSNTFFMRSLNQVENK